MSSRLNIDALFSARPKPLEGEVLRNWECVRAGFEDLAYLVAGLVPESPEQTLALRDLKTAQMQSRLAIAMHGKPAAAPPEAPD